jgi:two-component system, cell cycle response regulator
MSFKILSIDDSKMVRLLVSRAFKKLGCEVFEAGNGLDGISIAKQERPDVIILDLTMPVMDGMETLAEMKNIDSIKEIPVVMLTADGAQDIIAQLAKLGVRDHIIKPFKEQDIVDRVNRILPLSGALGAGPSPTAPTL